MTYEAEAAQLLAGGLVLVACLIWRPAPARLARRVLRAGSPAGGPSPAPLPEYVPESGAVPQSVAVAVPAAVAADLVVALLEAGLPVDAALQTVRRHLREAELAEPHELATVLEALELATQTGLAPGALVRAAAAEQRRRDAAAQSIAAQRLAVLVVLPMGLCLLPAFVVLTVVPLVLGLLAG